MTSLAERAAQLSPNARAALARELVRAGTAFPTDIAEPIAVVGIGCRFPGNVTGPDSFWQLLMDGVDTITEVPPDRWDAGSFYDPDPSSPGRMTTKWGGFVPDADAFDADFFGITPREAVAMDPQHRLLLEVAWEALEHAGIPPDSLHGSRTGVTMGLSSWDYTIVNIERRADIDAYLSTGTPHCAAVGRISYLLGLRGPAVAVDTACSSSLVAIHLACQSLRLRETDVALAGGVQLTLSPFTAIALSKWSALSPTGRCNSFDANADGFVRGEGCGVVVLKRLADALRDRDRVLAVVRGSATNSDGRSNGMTAPNALAQRDVITSALRLADVTPGSVGYVETHGTGTVLGDPIEFESLAATYGRVEGDSVDSCALGSVKTNIGHLEAAAGVAGFIKAVLAVQHGRIPRNLHFTRWNPAIDASATRLFVPTESGPWPKAPTQGTRRRAAVSSFGLSGTNAHLVIEQAPDAPATAVPTPYAAAHVSALTVSGKSHQRVASMAGALADWMSGPGATIPLSDVAHTLHRHRTRHPEFATVIARDRAEAIAGLRALAAGQTRVGVVGSDQRASAPGRVFVYSGQGSQWAGMGRQLLSDEPVFAKAIAELEPIFVAETGFSLQQTLADGEEVVGIERIQPVLVGMQLALTELWKSYGVAPDAVIGHSMGEVTAAVVAGALTPEQGLRVIATRSRLMARLSGQGAMALLESDADTVTALLVDYPEVTLAVHASPRQTVIAGPPEQVDAVISAVAAQNRLARRVEVDVASHHPIIDPILPELRSALADLVPQRPSIPLITTVYENGQPAMDASYWSANLRNPVRFHQAVARAGDDHHTFIEISPHPVLTHALTDTLADGHLVTSAMNRDQDQTLFFHAQLVTVGSAESDQTGGRLVDVPTTPWHHARFWVVDRSAMAELAAGHPLLGAHIEMPSGGGHVWQSDVGTDVSPWLADHKVFGQSIMPAAGFAEIALAVAGETLDASPNTAVGDSVIKRLEVEQMLPLDSHTVLTTQLIHHADSKIRVEIYSCKSSGEFTRHATATVDRAPHAVARRYVEPSAAGATIVSPADFYALLRKTGQHHGPSFAALTRIARLADGSAETEITVPNELPRHPGYRLHPVVLDAALQSLAAAISDAEVAGSAESNYLPVSFETIRIYGDVGRQVRCRAFLDNIDGGAGKLGKIALIDASGCVAAEVDGIYLRRVERRTVPLPLAQKIFDAQWTESPLSEVTAAAEIERGSWLVLSPPTLDAPAKSLADEFVHRWRSSVRPVQTANLDDESAMLAAFAETAGDPEHPPAGLVIFVGSAEKGLDGQLSAAREWVWSIATVVRAVVGTWHGRSPRLWLVTRGQLCVREGEPVSPATAALKGLVRVLAFEHPDLRATLLDLDLADSTHDPIAALSAELHGPDGDDLIARRGQRRFVERLSRATLDSGTHPVVRPGAAYVVTGGLGGLGLVVARWLVDRGAGRVILNGRSEPTEEQQKVLAELEVRAEIVFVRGDVAAPGVAESLVEAAGRAELRGVIHGAAVIEDRLVTSMTRDSLERVWAPKADGALRMHHASVGCELDWWLGFSSAASLLGSPGQAAYACASGWLDALVEWRRAAGLPAAAINWGPWSEVGVAQALVGSVLDTITPAEGIEALDELLAADRAVTGVTRLRADRALTVFPEMRGIGYFSRVVEELDTAGDLRDWDGPDALRDLDPAVAQQAVTDRMRARIAAVMGYADASAVDAGMPLTELGLDSLMAVRIRNGTRADFGVEPPVAVILQGASLRDLTADLMRQLGLTSPDAGDENEKSSATVRDRAQQRAAARQGAAMRRKAKPGSQGGTKQ